MAENETPQGDAPPSPVPDAPAKSSRWGKLRPFLPQLCGFGGVLGALTAGIAIFGSATDGSMSVSIPLMPSTHMTEDAAPIAPAQWIVRDSHRTA